MEPQWTGMRIPVTPCTVTIKEEKDIATNAVRDQVDTREQGDLPTKEEGVVITIKVEDDVVCKAEDVMATNGSGDVVTIKQEGAFVAINQEGEVLTTKEEGYFVAVKDEGDLATSEEAEMALKGEGGVKVTGEGVDAATKKEGDMASTEEREVGTSEDVDAAVAIVLGGVMASSEEGDSSEDRAVGVRQQPGILELISTLEDITDHV
jgi:hypothetical protein